MANKVGSIMARHNGANIEVAGIYDEKVAVSELIPNYDVDDRPAFFNVHFDPVNGVIDDCGNATAFVNPNSLVKISTEHAVTDYSAHFSNTAYATVSFSPNQVAVGATDFTFDGWFFIDPASTVTQTYLCTTHQGLYPIAMVITKKSSSTVNIDVLIGSSNRTFSTSNEFLSAPFHIAHVYTIQDTYNYIFINGKIIGRRKLANFTDRTILALRIGANAQKPAANSVDVHCSWFRYSQFARWTEEFTPPVYSSIVGNGYLPIQHNNQTYYAPLVSEPYKQTPCLAVRHNNQNYYTVK